MHGSVGQARRLAAGSQGARRPHQGRCQARGNERVCSGRVGEAVQGVPEGVGDLDGRHPHQRQAQHLCRRGECGGSGQAEGEGGGGRGGWEGRPE